MKKRPFKNGAEVLSAGQQGIKINQVAVMIKNIFYAIIFLILLSITLMPQNYGTGLLIGDEDFANNAKSVPLMRGDYQNLPSAVSLKDFSHTPGNQGAYGTCKGWS